MLNLPISVRRVVVMIGIFALVFIVLEFNRRLNELNMVNTQDDVQMTPSTQAVQTQLALQTHVAHAGPSAAVEEYERPDGRSNRSVVLPLAPIAQPRDAPIHASTTIPNPPQPA